jgi:hypothetical protein
MGDGENRRCPVPPLPLATLIFVTNPCSYFHPEDGGDRFLPKRWNHLQGYTAESRRPQLKLLSP